MAMKAIYINQYGGREQLKYGEIPNPALRDHDVLIEVHSAAVNPVDWKIREGYLQKRIEYRFPLILGWDVSGVVAQVGSGVTKFKVGDPVFSRPAIDRDGTYAEYVAVDEGLVAVKPKNMSFDEAAAVPLAGLTAWEALVETAEVTAGQKVLVHAGSGGVGTFAIQIAKAKGAYVATTVSSRNVEFVSSLGADEVIDYTHRDFSSELAGYDIVFDTIGGEVQEKSYGVLRKNGMLISIAAQPDVATGEQYGVRTAYFFLQPDGEKLAKLGQMIEQEKVKSVIDSVFALADTAKAHERSESRHTRGKIVIHVR
jgi:NADPH:quinone reductase-like Zn-dependent oxidoreductase